MNRPELNQLIAIQWVDIQTDHSWVMGSAPLGAARCETVGTVCAIDVESLTVAACTGHSPNAATTSEVNLRMAIPWGCITSWAPLRKGRVVR